MGCCILPRILHSEMCIRDSASLENFRQALERANKVISEATADQADVNTTIDTLKSAYNSQMCIRDSTYAEDGESDYIEYMYEGDKKQFTYQFIDCTLPDNGYVKWTSCLLYTSRCV